MTRSIFTPSTLDFDKGLLRTTHSQQLERWVGRDELERISYSMRNGGGIGNPWPGPPIALANVPGRVYACGDGSFCGPIRGGYFGNLMDYTRSRFLGAIRRSSVRSQYQFNAGFASLSDLIAELTTGGKKQVLHYNKAGATQPAAGASNSLRRLGPLPAAGAAIFAAPPGGTVPTSATAGSMPFTNAGAADTLHLINWINQQTTAQSTSIILTDVIFGMQPNYNSTAAQAVTGVPTRYATAALAPGNFLPGNVTTVLPATVTNMTVTYVDNAGNAAEAGTAQAVRISSAVDTSPFTSPQWYYNLNAGDTGVQKMTSWQLSAAMATGAVDRTIEHPLGIMLGAAFANQALILDGINSAISFERIYDGAYLSLWEWMKSATPASTHVGYITLCSG